MLNITEAATFLRLNEQTVRRMAREGRLPARKVGREWRFLQEELDAWIRNSGNFDELVHEQSKDATPGGNANFKLTCLVVDDEEQICHFLSCFLEAEGYEVRTASNGLEAIESIREQRPDLIFLDLKMPVMDGPRTLRAIREEFGDIDVIILTGYPESELVRDVLPYSPVILLSKPASREQILHYTHYCAERIKHARGVQ